MSPASGTDGSPGTCTHNTDRMKTKGVEVVPHSKASAGPGQATGLRADWLSQDSLW